MQEERRQRQQGHDVGPIEEPVHAIEAAGERESERAKERDRKPEEMQCRLVEGPSRANGGTDEQSEDAHRGKHVIEAAGAAGDWLEGDLGHFPRPESKQRVGVTIAGLSVPLQRKHLVPLGDRRPIDGQQDVAGANPRPRGGGSAGDLGRNNTGAALDPEHTVLDFIGGRSLRNVGDTHRQ